MNEITCQVKHGEKILVDIIMTEVAYMDFSFRIGVLTTEGLKMFQRANHLPPGSNAVELLQRALESLPPTAFKGELSPEIMTEPSGTGRFLKKLGWR